MTLSEENYLKTIFHLARDFDKEVPTNAIAEKMETKASSVTDMLKKLAEKKLVHYKKYQGVKLTDQGRFYAASIVRKHRLWEVFLVENLNFTWDEVHDVAEQLEHVKSEKLVDELDEFLGKPTVDPHGDPIPDKSGNVQRMEKILLSACKPGESGTCVGVKSNASRFLQYLDKLEIGLGNEIEILSKEPFDQSMVISNNGKKLSISALTANNIYIQKK
ncbi:metal-dependent transcriptional regulator [Robertkochia aurantiaca]|uniref:metal-dependent transcriptional regulator n=1 Tax=Robertkochia aurantiaca TaxID=2873700 RepID=UPI001CCC1C5E|nr:metal-dependent transcriptional regulator [Robertkochia sp. 3YJGBD-33]